MALSKLKASLASATSELTVAAANLNLDFSLFKFEAPATYQAFGGTLSNWRRDEAEHGTTHSTARKLGQLFNRALPPTPLLEAAYGTRVSEISARAEINPQGKSKDSLFLRQMGADGTTIWAAATSGPGAVPVHLLACMLARTWSSPQAISIWVEIVEERRKEIADEFDKSSTSHYPTLNVAQQGITREQLADWDASARAWLRAADEAMRTKMNQLRLAIMEMSLPVGETDVPYHSVMNTWKSAMSTMENLIAGQPQTIYSGAALSGISAWHILPDVIVFGSAGEEIKHDDPLVRPGGVLTIGLEYKKNEHADISGVHWSLSLAHLKFYGPPIRASSSLEGDNSRIYFDQFLCVALGAFAGILDCTVLEAASWFTACVDQISDPSGNSVVTPDSHTRRQVQNYLSNAGQWFAALARASSLMMDERGVESRTILALARCGERYGKEFFCPPSDDFGRLFGLCNPEVLLRLLPSSNLRLKLLRLLVERVHGPNSGAEMLIRYKANQGPLDTQPVDENHAIVWEFATVDQRSSGAESPEDVQIGSRQSRHKRWVQLDVLEKAHRCSCTTSCKDCACGQACLPSCHPNSGPLPCQSATDNLALLLRDWREYIAHIGEDSEVVLDPWTTLGISSGFHSAESAIARGLEFWFSRQPGAKPIRYQLVVGDPSSAALYVPCHLNSGGYTRRLDLSSYPESSRYANALKASDVVDMIQANHISAHQILTIIRKLDEESLSSFGDRKTDIARNLFRSLRAIGLATNVYKMLPSATVAIKTISLPFYKSHWIPSSFRPTATGPIALTRPQTFACVAMFESGHMNIEPSLLSEVFAMASVDSIYVTSSLLCDPKETPHHFELQRIVGNVGRAGMAMLIPPKIPQIKQNDLESWNLVSHAEFDGAPCDSFQHTSVHLDFSGYKLPLHMDSHGSQDVEVYLLESIVRVRDRGKWVADLNVLDALDPTSRRLQRHPKDLQCGHDDTYQSSNEIMTIDTWEELLELPQSVAVARAKDNWLSRLALTCVAIHTGRDVYILPSSFCWQCAIALAQSSEPELTIKQIAEAKLHGGEHRRVSRSPSKRSASGDSDRESSTDGQSQPARKRFRAATRSTEDSSSEVPSSDKYIEGIGNHDRREGDDFLLMPSLFVRKPALHAAAPSAKPCVMIM